MTGTGGVSVQLIEQLEGAPGVLRLGVASDEGVVHEGIRTREAGEDAVGVVEGVAARDCGCAVEDELAGEEGVVIEAGFGKMGMDLLEGSEGPAAVKECEAGVVGVDHSAG